MKRIGAPVEFASIIISRNPAFNMWIQADHTQRRSMTESKGFVRVVTASMADDRTELTSAPQAECERLTSFENTKRNDERLTKAITMPSLGLVGDGPTGAHFHEATTDSLSLVTNDRKDRFRKDLSMELAAK